MSGAVKPVVGWSMALGGYVAASGRWTWLAAAGRTPEGAVRLLKREEDKQELREFILELEAVRAALGMPTQAGQASTSRGGEAWDFLV